MDRLDQFQSSFYRFFFCRLSSNFYCQHSGKPASTYKKDYKTNIQAKAKNLKLTTPSPWRQYELHIETPKLNKLAAKEIQQKPVYTVTACKEYKSSLLRPTICLPETTKYNKPRRPQQISVTTFLQPARPQRILSTFIILQGLDA